MPAAPSSLTDPAIGQLLTAVRALGSDRARLLPVLAAVPDPRARRGIRHKLAVILGLAVCAVLAGSRSFAAIAEWAADTDQGTRDALGVTGVVPPMTAAKVLALCRLIEDISFQSARVPPLSHVAEDSNVQERF